MSVIANVVWQNENGDTSYRPSELNVAILRNSQTYTNGTITAQEGWSHEWENLSPSQRYQYTVRVSDQLERYTITYDDAHESEGWWQYVDTTTITMTFVPPPVPQKKDVSVEVVFYGDNYDQWGLRPTYSTVRLLRNGEVYDEVRIGEGWSFNWVWGDLDIDYTWTVEADDVSGYDKLITNTEDAWRVTYGCTYTPPVPPDPSPGNHPTKGDLDLMYSVLYDDVSAENAKDIIHILDYGNHIEESG